MEKTTLYLPADLQAALRHEAKREGRPQADLVRDAIATYLAAQPRPWPKSIGMAEDGSLEDSDKWINQQWSKRWDSHGRERTPSASKKS